MKIKPVEKIVESLTGHIERTEKAIEQHGGGLDALRELLRVMQDERRGLKATRAAIARSSKSTRTIDRILREQLFELQQVEARREGLKARRQTLCHDHWEMKSVISHLTGEEA